MRASLPRHCLLGQAVEEGQFGVEEVWAREQEGLGPVRVFL